MKTVDLTKTDVVRIGIARMLRSPKPNHLPIRRSIAWVTCCFVVTVVNSAAAKEWYVNNEVGNDRSDGTATLPFKTITRALRRANTGDRIVLANTGSPYRESVTLQGVRNSGTALTPFMLVGNGAILDGSHKVDARQWEQFDGDVFRFRPNRKSFQRLFLNDRPAERVQLSEKSRAESELKPKQWALHDGWIYFKVDANTVPEKYDLSCCRHTVGITLYQVSNVIIQDLIVQGFQFDGINCHDLCSQIVIGAINARGNGRCGVSIGGSSHCAIEGSIVGDNGSAQVRTEGVCKLRINESQLLQQEKYGPPLVIDGGKVLVDGKLVEPEQE